MKARTLAAARGERRVGRDDPDAFGDALRDIAVALEPPRAPGATLHSGAICTEAPIRCTFRASPKRAERVRDL
jgi:hypothetical protein